MINKTTQVNNFIKQSQKSLVKLEQPKIQKNYNKKIQIINSSLKIKNVKLNRIKIQELLNKLTFPEIPKYNLIKLQKQCEQLFAIHTSHSDIHYLLMIVYYHLKKYQLVRHHFKEIISFKVYEQKCYWIAAQTQFNLQSYDLCSKLTARCMRTLSESILPRLLHLQAKVQEEMGNFINSLVCYNELIKIKSNISEFYLQRAILLHKLGYVDEYKENISMFNILQPSAVNYMKQKILIQKIQQRRKVYLQILAQII